MQACPCMLACAHMTGGHAAAGIRSNAGHLILAYMPPYQQFLYPVGVPSRPALYLFPTPDVPLAVSLNTDMAAATHAHHDCVIARCRPSRRCLRPLPPWWASARLCPTSSSAASARWEGTACCCSLPRACRLCCGELQWHCST